jgi:hypothetical protein
MVPFHEKEAILACHEQLCPRALQMIADAATVSQLDPPPATASAASHQLDAEEAGGGSAGAQASTSSTSSTSVQAEQQPQADPFNGGVTAVTEAMSTESL